MSPKVTDVAIVGDGIAGLTVAHECAMRGLRVALCGSTRRGAATPASAGILGPSVGGRPRDDAVQHFMIAARDFYPSFLSRVHSLTGASVPTVTGILQFPESNAAMDAAVHSTPPDAVVLDRQQVQDLEPSLPNGWIGILHRRDGAVDVPALLAALHVAIDNSPSVVRRGMAIQVRVVEGTRATLDLHDGSKIVARHVVIANGAWAGTLLKPRPPIPVAPLKGEVAFAPLVPVRHVVFGAGGYLVPRTTELLIGATSNESEFDASTTPTATAALSTIADTLLPASAPWRRRFTRQIAGLRPVTPDLLPILGNDPDDPVIVYACGYSRNGVLLAPLAAACVAAVVNGETPAHDITAFAASRFTREPAAG
jgi:glycine oxidase